MDVLYFVDPLMDGISMEKARDLLGSRMCLVGGTNSITLATKDRKVIVEEVNRAVTAFASSGGFVLHPIDALSPDTPWEGAVSWRWPATSGLHQRTPGLVFPRSVWGSSRAMEERCG